MNENRPDALRAGLFSFTGESFGNDSKNDRFPRGRIVSTNPDLKRYSAGNSIHRFSVGGGIYDAPDAPTDFV